MKRVLIGLYFLLPALPGFADTPAVDEAEQRVIGLVQHAEDYSETGRSEAAISLLREAAELKPDHAEIYRVWGRAYAKQKQWPEAEAQYKKWAALKPQYYRPFEVLGEVANEQHRYADSNAYLAEAKRLNPYRTYTVNYRCHNFVLLQEWRDAVAECTAAIALDPNDEYAFGLRGQAERALGDDGAAAKDIGTADHLRGATHRTPFGTNRAFPVIIGAIAAAFLASGFAVLLRKKPLLFSSRWIFALMLLCFAPQFVISYDLFTLSSHLAGLRFVNALVPLMFVVLLAFLWIQMQGYMVLGVVDRSFRQALLAVLDELQFDRQEEMSIIRIPSQNLEIQVAIQGWMGVGQIRRRGKSGQQAFGQLVDHLKRRFSQGALETNNTTPILYIVVGCFMLTLCGFLWIGI